MSGLAYAKSKMGTQMLMSGKRFYKVWRLTIVMSLILLAGLLAMVYGYYQDSRMMVYVGIAVTVMTALNAIIVSMVLPDMLKAVVRRH